METQRNASEQKGLRIRIRTEMKYVECKNTTNEDIMITSEEERLTRGITLDN